MTYISLIVPTYNEAENLPQLVRGVHSAMGNHNYELIVVDDDSPDGTPLSQLRQAPARVEADKVRAS